MTGKVLLAVDTSVAVPLLIATHPEHARIARWARGRDLALCGHAIAETYAVITRLPGDNRLSAADAATLIDENFPVLLALSASDARNAHRKLADKGLVGGAVYDGLVALVASRHRATLVTRDARARGTYEALGVDVVIP